MSNLVPAKSILHVCKREVLRPLRDQILRLSGFTVTSSNQVDEALELFLDGTFDLVLIDIETQDFVHEAEKFCSETKTVRPHQVVAFVCNWRVAAHSTCPDEILRTEFDPAAFVAGVRETLQKH